MSFQSIVFLHKKPTNLIPSHSLFSKKPSSQRILGFRRFEGMAEDTSLVGSIDQGTSSTRFIVYNHRGQPVASHQLEFEPILPRPGFVEHDPFVLLNTVTQCMEEVAKKSAQISHLRAIGVTNQRETSLIWDKTTGKPLHNAIVWLDTRTHSTCTELIERVGSKDYFRTKTGLPIATYFSAMKLKWLIDNVPEVKEACIRGNALFGTVDTWLIWNLTGGINGGIHVTDVTNASRTMLMNLRTMKWDEEICEILGIPVNILPQIRSSSESYGHVSEGPMKGIVISGCLGDQQSALVGQSCFQSGSAKNTYGTGCFLLYNTGNEPIPSTHGLLTTVAYQLGPSKPVFYALEGSVAIAGAGIRWLRDNFGIIKETKEIDALAEKVEDTAGIYFVPAFSGLFAPYWREDARGVIVGLTQYTNKHHLARAVLESVCYQSREVLDAMYKDSGVHLESLKVDGGMVRSNVTLQMQADLLEDCPVVRPNYTETTALGAAFAAGLAVGVWKDEESLPKLTGTNFKAKITPQERATKMVGWKKAIQRSLDWIS